MIFFDLLLSSLVGWASNKILDVVVGCKTCGQQDNGRIGNEQWNHLECSNCHAQTKQFTNACDDTVDPATRRIGHAIVVAEEWKRESQGFFDVLLGGAKPRLQMAFLLFESGLQNRTLVFNYMFRDFENDEVLFTDRLVWTPCTCRDPKCNHKRFSCWQPGDILEKHKIIATDVEVLSERKVVLYQNRRLTDSRGVR